MTYWFISGIVQKEDAVTPWQCWISTEGPIFNMDELKSMVKNNLDVQSEHIVVTVMFFKELTEEQHETL